MRERGKLKDEVVKKKGERWTEGLRKGEPVEEKSGESLPWHREWEECGRWGRKEE